MALKRSIGKITLMFIVLNTILGAELFFVPTIAASYAGPASMISWVLMGLVAILVSTYFAELVGLFPKSGGVYEYVKQAYGAFPSFIAGWVGWLIANLTIALAIVGSLYYLLPTAGALFYIAISVVIILAFNFISYRGINLSAKILLIFGIATMVTLIILVASGMLRISPANLSPFFVFPISSTLVAMYFVSFVFSGWESATYLSEEIKNVRRRLPKTLIYATIIIAILSFFTALMTMGAANWQLLIDKKDPAAFISQMIFGNVFGSIFAIIIAFPMVGTAAGWIISSPRLLFAMSRDKAIIPSFQRLHKKYKTPYKAIEFQTVVSILVILLGIGRYDILLAMFLPLSLLLYSMVVLSAAKLRTSKPKLKRDYRAPLGKYGAYLIVMINIIMFSAWLLAVNTALPILLLAVMFVVLGVPLYWFFKLETDETFVENFFNRFSWFFDKTFPLWYSRVDIREVMKNLKLRRGDKVLDFGCGSGITTLEVAKRVGRRGTVVAIDLSAKQLERAACKIENAIKHSNVIFIKEHEPIPFKKSTFDGIVGVGVLEHLPDPEKTLKRLLSFLRPGGRFSFLSFGRSLGMPAPKHFHDMASIEAMFSRIGYDARVKSVHKKGARYWFIYGRK
ncbi:MAG: amino acid permease [Candidatus Aenigmatarchaeota archaeon]